MFSAIQPRKANRVIGVFGAGDGNRTHVRGLGSRNSTIEPRPLEPNVSNPPGFRQAGYYTDIAPAEDHGFVPFTTIGNARIAPVETAPPCQRELRANAFGTGSRI